MMRTIELHNKSLSALFDISSGALVGLSALNGRWPILTRAELGLSFEMIVPLNERLNHRVLGRDQKLTGWQVDTSGRTLILTWENPVSEIGTVVKSVVTGIVTLTDTGICFEGTVENRWKHRIENVAWPCIGEIRPPAKDGHLYRYAASDTDLRRSIMLPYFESQQGYWGADYPLSKSHTPHTAFMLAGDETRGLYIGHHHRDNEELLGFHFELVPGFAETWQHSAMPQSGVPRVQFKAVHFPYCDPGKTVCLTPVFLSAYTGSWHKGVETYRQWRSTWHQPVAVPDWCNDVHAWQQIQINSIAGEQRCRYSELIKHGRQCAKHGVKVIQLTGWTDNGQDGRMPSHKTDPRLGSRQDLSKAIARLRRIGVRTVLYEKFVYADISTDWYRRELHRYMARDINGNAEGHSGWAYYLPSHFAGFNTRRLDWACMHHPQWRRICRAEYRKSLELDADGVLLDESCHIRGDGRYCFAANHGHPVPAFNPQGDSLMMRELNEIARRHARPQLIVGESTHDLQTMEYGMTYLRIGSGHVPLLRYIDPFYPMMVAVDGYDDREKINACLMYRYVISYEPLNFKGFLDDYPKTVTYGKRVDALRRRYRTQLWDSIFEDTQGAHVTSGRKPWHDYAVFRHAVSGRRTVVIANHDPAKSISVRVRIDGYRGSLQIASPERPVKTVAGAQIRIAARSVVVVFQK